MNKKIDDESTKTNNATEQELKTRRKALKSILAASGVVAGSQALSSEWTRPLIESVVLPAHAQTSLSLSFSSGIIAFNLYSNKPWYAKSNLLDTLISPAQADGAHAGVRQSVCELSGNNIAGANGGSYQILFNISGSNVDICFSSLGTPDVGHMSNQVCTQQTTTSIDGQNIANADILMDPDDPIATQEILELRNMAYDDNLNIITGDLNIVADSSNYSTESCAGSFTCDNTTTPYSCNTGCVSA